MALCGHPSAIDAVEARLRMPAAATITPVKFLNMLLIFVSPPFFLIRSLLLLVCGPARASSDGYQPCQMARFKLPAVRLAVEKSQTLQRYSDAFFAFGRERPVRQSRGTDWPAHDFPHGLGRRGIFDLGELIEVGKLVLQLECLVHPPARRRLIEGLHVAWRDAAKDRHAGGAAKREAGDHPFGTNKQAEIRPHLSGGLAQLEVFFPVVACFLQPDEIGKPLH